MRNGRHVIGQVLIWALWTVITAGILLGPVFVVFMVWFIGWALHSWLWPRSDGAPRSARVAHSTYGQLAPGRRCGPLGLISLLGGAPEILRDTVCSKLMIWGERDIKQNSIVGSYAR